MALLEEMNHQILALKQTEDELKPWSFLKADHPIGVLGTVPALPKQPTECCLWGRVSVGQMVREAGALGLASWQWESSGSRKPHPKRNRGPWPGSTPRRLSRRRHSGAEEAGRLRPPSRCRAVAAGLEREEGSNGKLLSGGPGVTLKVLQEQLLPLLYATQTIILWDL